MTKFRRYASGDKPVFTASQLNAINEAALAHSQGKSQTLQSQQLRQRTGNHFPVANGTEDNLPAFSVLELQRALIEPDTDENLYKSAVAFNGIKPTEESIFTFGITQQYLPAGVIDAGAIVSGVSFARITGPTGATLAKVANDAYTLLSDEAGNIPVLYDPGEDTGERIAIVRLSGGGTVAATCTDQLRLNIFGNPTGGSLIIPVTHTDESDVETTENVTIAFDDTTTEIETAFAGHSKITSADVEVTSPGGPLPNQEMTIKFKNDVALSDLTFGVVNTSGLTGGASWTFAYLRTCCGD